MRTKTTFEMFEDGIAPYADGCDVIIETGTWLAGTTQMFLLLPNVKKIHTVEIGKDLHDRAKIIFKDNKKVKCWHGDSAERLPEIMGTIDSSNVMLYLDAHDSGGEGPLSTQRGIDTSPLRRELQALQPYLRMIKTVLIDDAIELTHGTEGWPDMAETLDLLQGFNIKMTNDRPNGLLVATRK